MPRGAGKQCGHRHRPEQGSHLVAREAAFEIGHRVDEPERRVDGCSNLGTGQIRSDDGGNVDPHVGVRPLLAPETDAAARCGS